MNYDNLRNRNSQKGVLWRHGLHHTTKTAKIKYVLLLLQHIVIMSTFS